MAGVLVVMVIWRERSVARESEAVRGDGKERRERRERPYREEALGTIGMLIRFARFLGSFVLFCECRSSADSGGRWNAFLVPRACAREGGRIRRASARSRRGKDGRKLSRRLRDRTFHAPLENAQPLTNRRPEISISGEICAYARKFILRCFFLSNAVARVRVDATCALTRRARAAARRVRAAVKLGAGSVFRPPPRHRRVTAVWPTMAVAALVQTRLSDERRGKRYKKMADDLSTEEFIREIQKYPDIWDLSSEDYKDKNKRNNAWSEVCRNVYIGFGEYSEEDKDTLSKCIL